MYPSDEESGATKALFVFIGLLVVGAIIAGMFLGGSELFSPSIHEARAERLEAEAAAMRAESAYEEMLRQTGLDLAEQQAVIELIALEERRARRVALIEPIAAVGIVVGTVCALTFTASVSYYFVAKAKGARGERKWNSEQSVYGSAEPSLVQQQQKGGPERSTRSSTIERTKVRSNDISYDGFLAYCHDYILTENSPRYYYFRAIAPEVEDVYLKILTRAQIITWEVDSVPGRSLQREIKAVEDVGHHISPRVFYTLLSSYAKPREIASLLS